MCAIDADPPIFITHDKRKAAKPHTCSECHAPIVCGEIYEVTKGSWERGDRPQTFKRCLLCLEIAQATDDVECSWCFGSLIDDAKQAVSPFSDHWSAPPEKMGRLVGLLFRSRELWMERP